MSQGYNPNNPGIAEEVTTSYVKGDKDIFRGFQPLIETTMSFTSGGNVITERTYPAFAIIPAQIDSIETITGAILAFPRKPFQHQP